ncbi:MAG: YtpR family tRNA-binding protein, partial [Rhodospirillaceae bacterium]
MKFTLSWLKDHLDTDATPQEIADRLTGLGLELEELIDPGAALGDFVVGHVVEAGQHPDADRLRLCKVDAGGGEMLQIVCGAPNARTGIKVALAKPGVVIPATGQALKVGKIRGVESRGMMCSARELLLGEDHDGIIELTETAETGAPLTSALSVDPVFDIAVTPNRPDALGVRGIARDLAASGLGTLKPDPLRPVAGSFKSSIDVQLDFTPETASACPMFVGRFIRGVKNVESPAWVKDRLTAIGLRPISALVDVTNYVSIDRCRPLHVFDAAKIQGPITPRLGREGESLLALDEKTYASGPSVCVIADATGPQALGGVMGGLDSGCTEETTDVFLESAYFDPGLTAATGRALAIESDAKHRFERGIDPKSCIEGAEMGTAMILELCGGEASDLVIVGAPPADPDPITLRTEQVARIG